MKTETFTKSETISEYKETFQFENFLIDSGLSEKMKTLVKIRVSQINNCDFCIRLHQEDLKGLGETNLRINSIKDWRTKKHYNEIEKAILAMAEELSFSNSNLSIQTIETASRILDQVSVAQVITIILATNFWNNYFTSISNVPQNILVDDNYFRRPGNLMNLIF